MSPKNLINKGEKINSITFAKNEFLLNKCHSIYIKMLLVSWNRYTNLLFYNMIITMIEKRSPLKSSKVADFAEKISQIL